MRQSSCNIREKAGDPLWAELGDSGEEEYVSQAGEIHLFEQQKDQEMNCRYIRKINMFLLSTNGCIYIQSKIH